MYANFQPESIIVNNILTYLVTVYLAFGVIF